ncbi:DJ-1/PfpI family protein [Actinocrispum wychmicini]|uniref:DJ-1/PfpI family protein n=1 Tax=Actinocrispum wychmicini TaxID=1213861 RepID=A0A4R2IN52_9PSEU|nr:DJ-1/PfpI family protein [Actinocrispum wychmicini]TCO46464.1 DJ-1/PfpI family protein [Actinocrispum wychmicini]
MFAQVVLFDGFDPLDVIAPYEVLVAGGMAVSLVSAEGDRTVPSGLDHVALTATADPQRADLVIVPGAAGPLPEIPAILGRAAIGLAPLLKVAMDRPETTVATVCGGSLLLAMAGLIAGRSATTHHLGMEALSANGVQAVDARIVDDGDLITAGGVTSGLDLGLYLLERFVSPRVAHDTGKFFEHERRGTVWAA